MRELTRENFVVSGQKWPSNKITWSIVPDGTMSILGPSTLFKDFGQLLTSWPDEIHRALETWAAVANVSFTEVKDDGSPIGVGGLPQGDPRFGDIRFMGAKSPGYWLAYTYFPFQSSTRGGDVTINTAKPYQIGDTFDLYSVMLHEVGLALGLAESHLAGTVMFPTYHGVLTDLTYDDIMGIQSIYGKRP